MKKANFISNFEPLNLNLKKKFGRRQTYFARNVEMKIGIIFAMVKSGFGCKNRQIVRAYN